MALPIPKTSAQLTESALNSYATAKSDPAQWQASNERLVVVKDKTGSHLDFRKLSLGERFLAFFGQGKASLKEIVRCTSTQPKSTVKFAKAYIESAGWEDRKKIKKLVNVVVKLKSSHLFKNGDDWKDISIFQTEDPLSFIADRVNKKVGKHIFEESFRADDLSSIVQPDSNGESLLARALSTNPGLAENLVQRIIASEKIDLLTQHVHKGDTLLHLAIEYDNTTVTKLLIDSLIKAGKEKALVATDPQGNTPFHSMEFECMDAFFPDRYEELPRNYPMKKTFDLMIDALAKTGQLSSLALPNKDGHTVLCAALRTSSPYATKIIDLLENSTLTYEQRRQLKDELMEFRISPELEKIVNDKIVRIE